MGRPLRPLLLLASALLVETLVFLARLGRTASSLAETIRLADAAPPVGAAPGGRRPPVPRRSAPPLRIGEDCALPEARCAYFRPLPFARRWIRERSAEAGWNASAHSNVSRCYRSMIDMRAVRCRSRALSAGGDGAVRCRFTTANTTGGPQDMDLPAEFTYVKILKAGGISALAALKRLGAMSGENVTVDRYRNFWDNVILKETSDHMSRVAEKQRSNGAGGHPIVAVVRDPVARFVSAAGQVLNFPDRLGRRCVENRTSTATERLRCAINHLLNHYVDPHFESMVADMYCSIGQMHDVQWSLYDISDATDLYDALGPSSSKKVHNVGADKDIVVTIDDMEEDMINTICDWYAVDVVMMRSLGFPVSRCP